MGGWVASKNYFLLQGVIFCVVMFPKDPKTGLTKCVDPAAKTDCCKQWIKAKMPMPKKSEAEQDDVENL